MNRAVVLCARIGACLVMACPAGRYRDWYLLAMAATIPLAGWALERFGARTVWMTSIAVFLIGSVLCGLAFTGVMLIPVLLLPGTRSRSD